MLTLIIMAFLTGVVGTTLGGTIGAIRPVKSNKAQSFLMAFASGVTIAVVFCDMLKDAFRPEGAEEDISMFVVVPVIALGFGAVYLLNVFIKEKMGHHHNHDVGCECGHDHHVHGTNLLSAGIVMTGAIGLHNLPAGLVIGASYAQHSGSVFGSAAFALSVVIFLHNIPEGMTVTLPLVTSGMKKAKATAISALAGVPIVLGSIAGYLVGMINPLWMSIAISFASGAMIYVIFGELLPEVYTLNRSKKTTIFLVIGMLLGITLCSCLQG